jgi:hypothetical protein
LHKSWFEKRALIKSKRKIPYKLNSATKVLKSADVKLVKPNRTLNTSYSYSSSSTTVEYLYCSVVGDCISVQVPGTY